MIGIYCRISKQKATGQDVSIETQQNLGIEFAKSEGMPFKTFIDEGISGTGDDISKRPEFVMLLDAIKKGEITKVYCIDQSRIERNNAIWNLFTHTMLNAGCLYYPNGRFLDLDIPENKLFTGIISLTNTFYASLTGKKVKMAIAANAKKGKTHGLTAYGYTKGEGGFFQIKESEAAVVKRIFQMSLDGLGTYTIANKLNEEEVPTKFSQFTGHIKRKDSYTNQVTTYNKANVRWRGNVIHDIIRNPIYKGTRYWNGEPVPVPAIIDEDYWQEVNDNLQNNKKKVGKREEYHYLLNGLVYCAHCNSELRGKKRLKGRDNAYKCKGKKNPNIKCDSRGISIAKLETFIIHHLFVSKDLQKFLAGLAESKEESSILKTKLIREKKEVERLIRVEKTAYKHLLDPDFENDEVIKEELKTTKQKIKDKKQTIEVLENKLIERDANNRVKRVKNIIGKYRFDAGFDDTKRLVHSLIKKITIQHHKGERGGTYFIRIWFNGFDELSFFMTDWEALRWVWVSQTRTEEIAEAERKEMKADLEERMKLSGEKGSIDATSIEVRESRSLYSVIQLNRDELIQFD